MLEGQLEALAALAELVVDGLLAVTVEPGGHGDVGPGETASHTYAVTIVPTVDEAGGDVANEHIAERVLHLSRHLHIAEAFVQPSPGHVRLHDRTRDIDHGGRLGHELDPS